MKRSGFALLALLAAAASAQPVLPADSVRAVVNRAARAGFLTDSMASQLAQCADAGVPVTRGLVVRFAAIRSGRRLIPGSIWPGNPEISSGPPRAVWADSLAAIGLLTPADAQAISSVSDRLLSGLPQGAPASAVAAVDLGLVMRLAEWRETLDAGWLAEDARLWAERGLLTAVGRERLLTDARAGRLTTPQDVVPYLDAAEITDVAYTRYAGADRMALDTLAVLIDAGVRLLRRRGVADLRVESLAIDSVQTATYGLYSRGWEDEPLSPRPVLSAVVDGEPYRQILRYASPLTVLNRVLRDRKLPHRLVMAPLGDIGAATPRTAILVLSPADRQLLDPSRIGDLSPARQAVIRASSEWGDSPCRELAFRAGQIAALEINLDGPTATGREGPLTRDGLTRTLDGLAAAGLPSHVGPDTLAAIRRDLSSRYLDNPQEILHALPDVVVAFHGDDATYGVEQPYADMIRQFAGVSRGAFKPESVIDTFAFEADSARVGFTLDGTMYETTVETGSWLYASFVDLIAQATAGHEVQLYRLGRDTEEGFAFLTREQFAALGQLGLLSDGANLVTPGDYD